MRPTIQPFLLFCCLFLATNSQASSCLLDNTQTPSGTLMPMSGIVGQQFTACADGDITSITVNSTGGNIQLYLVAGNGSSISASTPYQTFTSRPSGVITLPLSNPFPVIKGLPYAFGISGPTDVTVDATPTSAPFNPNIVDGGFLFGIIGGTFTENSSSDLFFAVNIEMVNIPALSQWGLFILALLMLNIGLFYLIRLVSLK